MSQQKRYKLYVRSEGQPSINILRYIDSNIKIINDMGIRVKIIKISKENIKKKVVIPALLIPGKRTRLGINEIKSLFEENKKRYEQSQRQIAPAEQYGNFPDDMLSRLYHEELSFDRYNEDKGKDESAAGEGLTGDFGRRISDQLSRRGVKMGSSLQGGDLAGAANDDLNERTNREMQRRTAGENNLPRENIQPVGLPENYEDIQPRGTKISQTDYPTIGKGEVPSDDIFEQRFLEGIM